MRIGAHLGVKDEVELIEGALAHLRAIGVDLIIACDMGSTDGTLDVLERHRGEEGFLLAHNSDEQRTDVWLQNNAELAQQADVDWVMFVDADEYWIPASGSLRDCPDLASADVLAVARYNIPLASDGPLMPNPIAIDRYDELLLITDAIPAFRTHLRENDTTPWIRGVPIPKVIARRERIGGLVDGMHDILPMGSAPLKRSRPRDLVIAHLPFTTRSRFRRKVDNIRRAIALHDEYLGQDLAWHWRRWLEMDEQGRLDEEFDRTVFDAATIERLRSERVIRSAAELFAERRSEAW
jgi:glycosyltransferase involved in cell wall biosynthesis